MSELINEGFSIDIILKNISALKFPAYNMMQGSRGAYAGLGGMIFVYHKCRKEKRIIS